MIIDREKLEQCGILKCNSDYDIYSFVVRTIQELENNNNITKKQKDDLYLTKKILECIEVDRGE